MVHTLETIKDNDKYFTIDPITRTITNQTSAKNSVTQYDHNSEVFAFKIPRIVEGHDMSTSDSIQIHYLNKNQSNTNPGLYEVEDATVMIEDGIEYLVFSWLVSRYATQLTGDITFQIKFICYHDTDRDLVDYLWGTKVFSAINVSPGINNTDIVLEQSYDILQQWKHEIDAKINVLESIVENNVKYIDVSLEYIDGEFIINSDNIKSDVVRYINMGALVAIRVIYNNDYYIAPVIYYDSTKVKFDLYMDGSHIQLTHLDDGETDASWKVEVQEPSSDNTVDQTYVDGKIQELENKLKDMNFSSGNSTVMIENTDIEKTCIKFAKMLYGINKAESFIYFTDPHLCNPPGNGAENRILTSLDVLKTYYDATPTSFLVCGGDWLNDVGTSNTNDDACYKLGRVASLMRAKFDRCYTAIGNHEDNFPYGAAYEGAGRYTVTEGLSMKTIRNLMLPYEKELYYSFDGAQTKFYVMNSADIETDNTMTDYRWGQVAWLAERLKEDDANNSALVIHAALLRPIGDGVFAHLAENLLKLCEAYNNSTTITLNDNTYDFAGCTGCVRFMLAGHVHDADCAEIHYGIPVVLTYNLLKSADGGNGIKPTFDLCLADYDAEILRMVRVGMYGTDRVIPMASRTATGNIFTISMNMTDVTASNAAISIREGDSYENTLTIPHGYTMDSVVVTMGGVDVTDDVYIDGVISIDNVVGNIVITAIAAEIPVPYTNLLDLSDENFIRGKGLVSGSNTLKDVTINADKAVVTNLISVEKGDVIRFKGFDRNTALNGVGNGPLLMCLDENRERVINLSLKPSDMGNSAGLPLSANEDDNGVTTYTIMIRGDKNEQFTYNEICDRVKYIRISAYRLVEEHELIVTKNEEIYPTNNDSSTAYTNQLSNAVFIDDAKIANETTLEYGYVNGYTIDGAGTYGQNSQGLTDGYVSTGFIKGPAVGSSTPIYVKGMDWITGDDYCRIYTHASLGSTGAHNAENFNIEKLGDKYFKFTYKNGTGWPANNTTGESYYYRIALYGNISDPNDLIITHGEPIE